MEFFELKNGISMEIIYMQKHVKNGISNPGYLQKHVKAGFGDDHDNLIVVIFCSEWVCQIHRLKHYIKIYRSP